MNIGTLLRFLVGDREAILRIAACRSALWLGLLFVLSAGLAREYDGEYLLAEPWHLLLPLGASLVTSFLLYCLLGLVHPGLLGVEFPFWQTYRRFLSLYWMTAPLAWLYAIPFERFFTAVESVQANLWLLALVAAWRVVLMVRVVAVLLNLPAYKAVFPVLLFADAVALALLRLTPLPVVSLMGGIRLSEGEVMIQQTAFLVAAVGILTAPIWLIGTLVVACWKRKPVERAELPSGPKPTVGASLWIVAAVSLLIGAAVLPLTQPEQQLRYQVEAELREGRIEQALRTMSAHRQSDFPPHWDPPPQLGYGETTPAMLDIMESLLAADAAPWVIETFRRKYRDYLDKGYEWYDFWEYMDGDQFDRHLTQLESLPDDSPTLAEQREILSMVLNNDLNRYNDEPPRRTPRQHERLRRLIGEEHLQANQRADAN